MNAVVLLLHFTYASLGASLKLSPRLPDPMQDTIAFMQSYSDLDKKTNGSIKVYSRLDFDPFELDIFQNAKVIRNAFQHVDGAAVSHRHFMWVHLVKSAGEMMCHWARKAGENVVPSDNGCNWRKFHQHMIFTGKRSSFTTCDERSALIQEYGYTWEQCARELNAGDICFDQIDYGIMLRETKHRLESFVNYFGVPDSTYADAIECVMGQKERCKIETWWSHNHVDSTYVHRNFDNFLVRMLGGYDTMVLPPGGVNASHFDTAKNLLEKFKIVIPLEGIAGERARTELQNVLGWHIEVDEKIVNQHSHATTFSQEHIDKLVGINKYDIALYNMFAAPYM